MKKTFRLLALLAFLVVFSASLAFAQTKQVNIIVKGMMCSSCAKKMETRLHALDGVDQVKVNLKSGIINVTMKDGKDLSNDLIVKTINDHDYKVAKIDHL
jgi:copper chaperone CopZ